VERARLALKQMSGQTTTTLAADLGYYDQSHFIREFDAVIGMTPYAYMKRNHKQSKAK
jgi:AraC-like DNA-binding protein